MITINFTNVTAENAAKKINNMQQVLDENIELEYESGVIFEKSQRNLSKHQIYIRGNGKHKGYFRNQKYDLNKKEAPNLSASIQGGMEKPLASSTSSISKSIVKSREFNNILQVNIDPTHKQAFEKALRYTSLSFGVPLKAGKGEGFIHKAQEDLHNSVIAEMTDKTRQLYDFMTDYFDLPSCAFVTKAYIMHRGKILYSPESGKPIKRSELRKFKEAIEKFINRNYSGYGEKFILSSEALARALDRMLQEQEKSKIRKMSLEDFSYKGKKLDWISKDINNLTSIFPEITRNDMARIQVATDSAANRVTAITDKMRNDMQQIIIDGIKAHQSKNKVSQNLFDKCASLNRDIQKIADSEMQNNFNVAFVKEEVYNTVPGERVYFRRVETIDDNTCEKCKKLNETIVAWSDYPLESETIKDDNAKYAIWDGKNELEYKITIGTIHPYCRGVWERYRPEIEARLQAHNDKKKKVHNE